MTKKDLTSLTLSWKNGSENRPAEKFEEVLKGLQPHQNLEKIVIESYPGSRFPNWMSTSACKNLKEISLRYCQRCEHLPLLGKLPSLTRLDLFRMDSIKRLYADGENSFPALTSLKISKMPNFEEWTIADSACKNLKEISLEYCQRCEHLPLLGKLPSLTHLDLHRMDSIKRLYADGESSFPALTSLEIQGIPNFEEWTVADSVESSFPCLIHLSIHNCPKLAGLPKLPSIRNLYVEKSSAAVVRSITFLTSLISLHFGDCGELDAWPEGLLQNNKDLERLSIVQLPIRTLSNVLDNLSALRNLSIYDCNNLDEVLPDGLKGLNSLEKLEIRDCNGLRSFPAAILEGLPSLKSLEFEYCDKLKPLSGPLKGAPTALHSLIIVELPELEYLPKSILMLSALRELSIYNCEGLCCLPNWLSRLESLSEIEIVGCKKLNSLPDDFKSLTSVSKLYIHDSPQLQKRCRKLEGEDWPKISHIPFIRINWKDIQRLDQ